MITRQDLTAALTQGICEVTFTKLNGEVRTMPCTLKAELLPVRAAVTEQRAERKHNDAVMSAYCTDKNEWRSFRVENVTEIKQLG
jgi:hypothetical protein